MALQHHVLPTTTKDCATAVANFHSREPRFRDLKVQVMVTEQARKGAGDGHEPCLHFALEPPP